MGKLGTVAYLALHPTELRSIVQWKLYHEPVHTRDPAKETPTEQSCFRLLNLTSRSFSAVIQELSPELLMPVALFYLVLRGLDTIEDDMTIDIAKKEPLLRHFHEKMEIDGWTFNENGPNEKDRELLVRFDDVIVELKRVKKEYYDIIRDITIKMGNGMADYAVNADHNEQGVNSVADYELYCHYVAGLVGEGLTRLFVQADLANPALMKRPELTESMGQFLQKTNIIRDIREDFEDGRRFYPREIWSKYVDRWEDMFNPAHRTKAMHCISEMVLNALKHADECLFYMAGIREQSVFNFVAIPQSMAIASLELIFNNPAVLERNVKITKGSACNLMSRSTQNLRIVCDVFREYTRKIHAKNDPRDPNFMAISVQCGKIEQFIESIFPTQNIKEITATAEQKRKKAAAEGQMETSEIVILIGSVFLGLLLMGGTMIGLAWFFGAEFHHIFDDFRSAARGMTSGVPEATTSILHEEL